MSFQLLLFRDGRDYRPSAEVSAKRRAVAKTKQQGLRALVGPNGGCGRLPSIIANPNFA
jgi:hypothetical protein